MRELASLNALGPERARIARRFLSTLERATGQRVTVTSVLRSSQKQAQLWRACKSGRSRFPAAYPGTSSHEVAGAFDIMLDPPGPGLSESQLAPFYALWGLVWERLGLRWGGRFRDSIHFDFYPRGFTPSGDPRSCKGPG